MSSLLERAAHCLTAFAATAAVAASAWAGEGHKPGYYGYGAAPSAAEIAGWSISVRPDGQGLPPGRGTVEQGANLFVDQCGSCHGTFGEGAARYPKLTGG